MAENKELKETIVETVVDDNLETPLDTKDQTGREQEKVKPDTLSGHENLQAGKKENKTDDSSPTRDTSGEAKKEDQTILTSLEDYIKTAAYLGTKVITPTMRKYVYRRRLDGLAILNTLLVDKKLAEGIEFIKRFKPDEWTLICKREAGWRGAKMFSELTGVRTYMKKYPSGVLTNTVLDDFIETKMILICDPWLDKNALKDAQNIRIPVCAVCDTNNHTTDCDVVIIGNNKSNKSMGLFFWLMAREYMKAHGIEKEVPSLEDFVGEKLILEEPRKKKIAREKKERDLEKAESAIEEKMRMLTEKADSEAAGGFGGSDDLGSGEDDVMKTLAEKADEEVKDGLKEGSAGESIKVGEGAVEGV